MIQDLLHPQMHIDTEDSLQVAKKLLKRWKSLDSSSEFTGRQTLYRARCDFYSYA